MLIDAKDVREGYVLKIDGLVYTVSKVVRIEKGRLKSFVHLSLVGKGRKIEKKLGADDRVHKVDVFEKDALFTYFSNDSAMFLNLETQDEASLPLESIENKEFLTEGMSVFLLYVEENLIGVKMPNSVICEVEDTAGYIKGQTAASQDKPATLKNGVVVKVPTYVIPGDLIRVKLEDEVSFIERIKKE